MIADFRNTTVVVAAGGNDGDSRLDVVEIFRDGKWRTGRVIFGAL